MAMVEGPLSPHLQVYKPQLTSILSITHRGTGVFLSLGSLIFAYWLMSVAAGPVKYAEFVGHASAWYGQLILLGFAFSFYYHLCNGIRHLFWDIGAGLEIDTAYKSGYLVIFSSVLLTLTTVYLVRCTG